MSKPIPVTAPLASPATWEQENPVRWHARAGEGRSHHHVRMDVIAISPGRPPFRGPQLTCYALAY